MSKKPTGSRPSARSTDATVTQAVTGATMTGAEVRQSLSGAAPRLEAVEEKALRMLHGAAAPRTLVLERVGQDHPDAREKLLSLELELLRQWRDRQRGAAPSPAASTEGNPRRARIIAALRSRKP